MGDVTQPDKEDVTDNMDMNTGGADLVHEKCTDGDSYVTTPLALFCLNHPKS